MGHSVTRYVCSLAPLTPLTRFVALRFATLALLARSIHRLAHSLRSLPHGTVENLEYVFTLLSRFTGTNAFLVVSRSTPNVLAPVKQRAGVFVPQDFVMTISFVEFCLRGESCNAQQSNNFAMSLKLTPRVVFYRVSSFKPRYRYVQMNTVVLDRTYSTSI